MRIYERKFVNIIHRILHYDMVSLSMNKRAYLIA